MRSEFEDADQPILSVDTKKKELIGNFYQSGKAWTREPVQVLDHDFPSQSEGKMIPYGVYDVEQNEGFVLLGHSHDTACFAVEAISLWLIRQGRHYYDNLEGLLILADGGGSNGSRNRGFKYFMQKEFCDRFNIPVTVCHYPPGASKWNPIEHRLFSAISSNFAGTPLRSIHVAQSLIDNTTNKSGLRVESEITRYEYCTGIKISPLEMGEVNICRHHTLPQWNYTIYPQNPWV